MPTVTGRPTATEFSPFYSDYIGLVTEEDVLAALERQADEFLGIAASVPTDRETWSYGPDKWSIREVFGHLVDAERVFGYRAYCISRGERAALPGFDEDTYVQRSPYADVPLSELSLELSILRRTNLMVLQRVGSGAGSWTAMGNANGADVSLRALAHILLGHARHHMGVLRERYGVTG